MLVALRGIWETLRGLGTRRIAALGLVGLTVFVVMGLGGYLLSRPQMEVLYTGLQPDDVTRMGAVLQESGLSFDVSAAGDTLLAPYGTAAKARMTLAQRGLPRGDSAGYELFDKIGTLGLTSFMQQVTRVRVLEGELARTIQLIDGVKAVRVHLGMASDSGFRRSTDKPTASVILRLDGTGTDHVTRAIRHLVAAAIPGLTAERVTILTADGTLVTASGEDGDDTPEKLVGLERNLASDIEARISKALSAFLGPGEFRVSVSARLNVDRRETRETAFDPASRVERSVKTVKESGEAQNANGSDAVTVEQNIPVDEPARESGDSSRERKDRKEELTNFEISSKSTATTSSGYDIERLSIAVVANRSRLAAQLGGSPGEEALTRKLAELRQLAIAAAGVVEERGDILTISSTDFVSEDLAPFEPDDGGILSAVSGHMGALINAAAALGAVVVFILFGMRPALRRILELPATPANGHPSPALPAAHAQKQLGHEPEAHTGGVPDPALEHKLQELKQALGAAPQERLRRIVELDPDRAANVLKQWLGEPEAGVR